jgi:hypothetical protein
VSMVSISMIVLRKVSFLHSLQRREHPLLTVIP